MFIISLYRFLLGYVRLKVSGNFPERILNLCAQNKIVVWNIFRNKNDVTFNVSAKNFKKLRKIRGKSGVKIKIIEKIGFPFKIKKYRLRFGIIIGLISFFVLLKIFSLFVWDIQITGNKTITDEEIINQCYELGIYNGKYIKDIDTKILKDKLLLKSEKLAWASINIEGCVVTVNVSESRNPAPDFTPRNIVSSSDAVIKQIEVTSGELEVYNGQAVSRGDILISGTVVTGDKISFTKASGVIFGEVEESILFTKKYNQEIKNFNNKIKYKTVLEFFGIKLPLYIGETRGDFIGEYQEHQIYFLGKEIPIKLHKMRYDFYEMDKKKFDRNELITQIENEFEEYITKEGFQEITITGREIIDNSDGISVKYTLKHLKNLCIEENLLFSTLN